MKKIQCVLLLLISAAVLLPAQETEAVSTKDGLSVLATMAPSSMYFAYMSLCAVGDAYVGLVYDGKTAADFARETIDRLKTEQTKVTELKAYFTVQSDIDVVDMMIETYGHLIEQAEELISFINNPETSEFQGSRNKTWRNISALLKQ
ncbi:MAG: hypothetical protein ACLFST_11385 [Spirochaetia bacterium]